MTVASDPRALAVDGAGDLFMANYDGTLTVLPRASGTIFGVPVTASTTATLLSGLSDPAELSAMACDGAGNL